MELLEEYFDTAFDAPDGIKKLRELILTLAMQGKLVPQNPEDQPASELLEEIEAEKQQLIKEKKIKKQKALPEIKSNEIKHGIPKNWQWTRLGNITLYNSRKKINANAIEPDAWLLELEDIEKHSSKLLNRFPYSKRESKSTKSEFADGDVLYGKLRPYLDKVIVADRCGVCTTEIVPITPLGKINPNFIKWMLKRPSFLAHVNSLMYGVKMPRLGTTDAISSIQPLPPLEEQHRIVAKIDQLMARCDELEKLQSSREEKRISVHTSAVRQLLEAKEKSSFTEAWQFLTDNFGDLYSVKKNVAELRKAILQLAVMGKLVPQKDSDEPVDELLKKIGEERESHKITTNKSLNTSLDSYTIPESWSWLPLGSLTIYGPKNGYSPKAVNHETSTKSLTLSATTAGTFKGEHSKFIDEVIPDNSELWLSHGDILVQRGNTIEYVGVPAVYKGHDKEFIYPDLMMKIRFSSWLNIDYIHYAMSAEPSRDYLRHRASGTSGTMPKINQKTLKNLPLPIPPQEEQKRIVAKVDQLMTLCDNLEQQIDNATEKQTALLNSLMAQV